MISTWAAIDGTLSKVRFLSLEQAGDAIEQIGLHALKTVSLDRHMSMRYTGNSSHELSYVEPIPLHLSLDLFNVLVYFCQSQDGL